MGSIIVPRSAHGVRLLASLKSERAAAIVTVYPLNPTVYPLSARRQQGDVVLEDLGPEVAAAEVEAARRPPSSAEEKWLKVLRGPRPTLITRFWR